MNIQFTLSSKERNLILQRVGGLSEGVRARLRMGVVGQDGLLFEMPEEEFEDFMDTLESVVAITDDRELLKILVPLYDLVEEEDFDDDEFWSEDDEDTLDPVIEEAFTRVLEERQPETVEEAFAILKEFITEHNLAPQPDFDGLSPEQLYRMLYVPWDDPNTAIMLHDSIPSELLNNNNMLHNTRLLLNKIKEAGCDKATPKGRLNQKLTTVLRPHLKGALLAQSRFDGYKKVWREDDFRPLVILRPLLLEGGYLRKSKGLFKVTRKGERLLAPENGGQLLADLFLTYFRKFNIAYPDRLPPCETVQLAIPYSLMMIRRYATEWTSAGALSEMIFAPFVEDQIRAEGIEYYKTSLAQIRVLHPLQEFGLLESKGHDDTLSFVAENTRLRITPLFDALIEFRL